MTTTTSFARTSVIAFASGLIALATPAFAAAADDALPQTAVNVAHTDFTSAKAIGHLKAQVRRAAFKICVPDGNVMTMPADQRKCYETAVNGGLAQIASRQEQALRSTTVNVASVQGDIQPAH